MDSSESWAIGFLVLFLIVSFTFSLVKASFSAIYAKREAKDREGREEKVAALVETGGFNETISIGRIFCNVGSGVLGFFLFEMLPWAWVQQYWFLGFAAYIVVASFCIYTLTVFCANLLGNLKPDTLAVVLIPLYRYIRLPFIIPAKICHALFVKTLKGMGYDSKLSFLPEERRDAVQADLSDDNGSDGEGLEKEERQMILNIFDFVETPVREIMTPRVDMCAIDVDTPLEDLVKVLNSERHSRLPVYKETVDNIVGILSNRDFLQWYTERHEDEPLDIMKLVMPPVFVPYHKKIDDMLTELRKTGNQLAIVVDEYGGTAGLVTLEDILEEIVGEIRDEDDVDEDEDVQKLKDGRYILDPLMTLSDLEYELGVELEAPENSHVETLSGLIQATLGIIPSPGAEVVIKGYTFRVLKMDGTRMEKVLRAFFVIGMSGLFGKVRAPRERYFFSQEASVLGVVRSGGFAFGSTRPVAGLLHYTTPVPSPDSRAFFVIGMSGHLGKVRAPRERYVFFRRGLRSRVLFVQEASPSAPPGLRPDSFTIQHPSLRPIRGRFSLSGCRDISGRFVPLGRGMFFSAGGFGTGVFGLRMTNGSASE